MADEKQATANEVDEDKYVGKKVKFKNRERGGAAARWPACEVCGNEVGNTTYQERAEVPAGAPPVIHKMIECGGCGQRWKVGSVGGGLGDAAEGAGGQGIEGGRDEGGEARVPEVREAGR